MNPNIITSWREGKEIKCFGYPRDNILRPWVDILEKVFDNYEQIPEFLCVSLDLPNKLNDFNYFWKNLGYLGENHYDVLKVVLRSETLSKVDLCCMLFECENHNIFKKGYTIWTLIERF